MSSSPAANFIPDFTASFETAEHGELRIAKPLSQAELIEQTYQQGFEAGQAEARARYEKEVINQSEQAAQILADAQEQWKAVFADRFINALKDGLRAVTDEVADGAVNVLQRYVAEWIRPQCLHELTDALNAILDDEAPTKIEISGPAEIIDHLRQQLLDIGPLVVWNETDTVEVRIRVDSTLLETRIESWLSSIMEQA